MSGARGKDDRQGVLSRAQIDVHGGILASQNAIGDVQIQHIATPGERHRMVVDPG